MEINFDELKDWSDGARRALDREREKLKERVEQFERLTRAMETIDEIYAENERLKAEVDDLNEQLEQRGQEMDDMRRQHEQEIDDLRRQLLEAKNRHLETEIRAKPMEIHNHFEPGSSSQVFNDQVSGKFTKNQNDKSVINKKRNDIKKNKKKWKKSIRKIL